MENVEQTFMQYEINIERRTRYILTFTFKRVKFLDTYSNKQKLESEQFKTESTIKKLSLTN